jgi:hypothetical protein
MSHDRGFNLPGWKAQPGEAATTAFNDAAAGPRFTIADAPSAPACKGADTEPRRWRELHKCVAGLLETNCGIHISAEKRTQRRFPFHKPLTITPINDKSGQPELGNSFGAFGIDLSSVGIGFLARQLIPTQKAILTCNGSEDAFVNLLFEPRWVRFTRGGWYQIGGRLVDVLDDTTSPAPGVRLMEQPPSLDRF